ARRRPRPRAGAGEARPRGRGLRRWRAGLRGGRRPSARYRSSNSKVLTTRIRLTGVLVGLNGADSSPPSRPKIWIEPWLAERMLATWAAESAANCWAVARAFRVASARSWGRRSLNLDTT